MGGSHDMSEMHGDGGHNMSGGGHGSNMPSVTIAPGETETLAWTVPENADSLEYACNIPGHYESGMYGNFSF
jgi:uncharacterized cupredoxin-like copper-binding protein